MSSSRGRGPKTEQRVGSARAQRQRGIWPPPSEGPIRRSLPRWLAAVTSPARVCMHRQPLDRLWCVLSFAGAAAPRVSIRFDHQPPVRRISVHTGVIIARNANTGKMTLYYYLIITSSPTTTEENTHKNDVTVFFLSERRRFLFQKKNQNLSAPVPAERNFRTADSNTRYESPSRTRARSAIEELTLAPVHLSRNLPASRSKFYIN